MGSLGFSCYRPLGGMNWAPVLGLRQRPGHFTRPAYNSSFNPASRTWEVGLRAYFLNPIIRYVFLYTMIDMLLCPIKIIICNAFIGSFDY